MSAGGEVAGVLLASHRSRFSQHLCLDVGTLRTAAVARPVPRSEAPRLQYNINSYDDDDDYYYYYYYYYY